MSDIFVCYSRKDSAAANRLRAQLESAGWTVFLDVSTRIGQRYDQVIERELEAARAVVVLWSAASRQSHDVKDEAKTARDRSILFPALIERVKPPLGFGHLQTADLVGWYGDGDHPHLLQLVESLRVHLDSERIGSGSGPGQSATEPVPVRQQAKSSRAPWAGEEIRPDPAPAESASPAIPAPGQTFRDKLKNGGEGPLMVVIPAGRFRMGSPPDEPERSEAEGPQHEVRIARPFAMGVHAVTFDEYDRFCGRTRDRPGDEGWGRADRPVINVSWNNAQDYCAWLSEQTGRRYRLPSEAEWEYACRAGTTTPFHFGARVTMEQANFHCDGTYSSSAASKDRKKTTPVGSFPANTFGLHDMHGNVWEWCQDNWHPDYKGAPDDGTAWEGDEEESRVLRGGAWNYDWRHARAADRFGGRPEVRHDFIGFRVCRAASIE